MHHCSVLVSSSFLAATLLLAAIVAFSSGLWFARKQQEWVALSSKSVNARFQPLSNQIMLTTSSFSTGDDDKEETLVMVDGDDKGDSEKDRMLHFLVDIVSRDDGILQSKENMLNVLLQLADALEIGPALSQHCHEPTSLTTTSAGIQCFVLLQKVGHISILSRPPEHTIYLDILSKDLDENEVKDVLTLIHSKFAALSGPITSSAPAVHWSMQKRGFRTLVGGDENPEDVDIDKFMVGTRRHKLKQIVAQEMSAFQSISIFDFINPKQRPGLADYAKSLQNDGSYQSLHPDLFRPDRIIYLDGIMQSRVLGEAAYHEALVHPALLMHPDPKRVTIIGGGEGATLREVLKHKTVEHVAMIDIDKLMVELCIEFLPEWNSCANLVGSAPLCFDDIRASIFYEDAVAWFLQRFRNEDTIDPSQRYDVIIMDALDPNSETPFSDYLYSNADFIMALSSSLGANGVLISQVGESDYGYEPASHLRKKTGLAIFTSLLKKYGFKSVDMYEEIHGGFLGTWSFLVALKDLNQRTRWDSNQAMLDLELRRRLMATNDGSGTPLKFVDGSTLVGYQLPPRTLQNTMCLNRPTPSFCSAKDGLDPDRPHAPSKMWHVAANETSTIFNADAATVALLAEGNVSKDSLLAVDERVQDLVLSAKTMELMKKMLSAEVASNNLKNLEALVSFINEYGTHVGAYPGEYLVPTSAISMLLSKLAFSVQQVDNYALDSGMAPFRRNAKTLHDAVWITVSVNAGEKITAESLGRHLF